MSTYRDNLTPNEPTRAQKIFADKELLLERPDGMDFEVYKVFRATQTRLIKDLFRSKPSRKIARLMTITPGYNSH